MASDALAGIDRLGRILEARGQTFRLIAVGGLVLRLRGVITRVTEDLDVIAAVDPVTGVMVPAERPLPAELRSAAALVAHDLELRDDWLNSVVAAQWEGAGLPPGMASRVEWREFGGLSLGLAGRLDLIALKLYAFVDRWVDREMPNKHGADLRALAPTDDEWAFALEWVLSQDGTPTWATDVKEAVHDVRHRG